MTEPRRSSAGSRLRWLAGVLLIIPIIMPLWVGTYARAGPELFGFPFYYWYQFLWILIGAVLTAIAYWLMSAAKRRDRRSVRRSRGDEPR